MRFLLSSTPLDPPPRRPLSRADFSSSLAQAACLIRVPTEVVKQRSQTSAAGTRSIDVFKRVVQAQGLRGLYRGFGSTVAREVPYSFTHYASKRATSLLPN